MTTLIRCTAKLRKEMGLKPSDLVDHDASKGLLGDWYAHLFFQNRKKCVLLASEKTLLTVVALAVSRDQLRRLDDLLREGLFRLLLDEGFQPAQAQPVFDACQQIEYAATADRSMTGSVNELVKEAEFWLGQMGGPAKAKANGATLANKLNTMPMKRIGYAHAIEATHALLGTTSAAAQ